LILHPHPQGEQWLAYRASSQSVPNLPLIVRSVGCYDMLRSWSEGPLQKWFLEIFWTSRGKGAFCVDGKWTSCGPGDMFIYRPGEVHELKAESDRWRYCWITFDHVDCMRWLEGFGLVERTYSAGPCPEDLFEQIGDELRNCLPEGERQAAHLAHALLIKASSRAPLPKPSSPATQAKQVMDERFHDPLFDIARISRELKVHRTTLFRLFHRQYGLTPSRYLQNIRLQKALAMLRQTPLPVQEIAERCGFSDPNYLARCVRRATGRNPREFRLGT
jgi:AraC-like DNA-binding protein